MFSIGDIVSLIQHPSHNGYVTEIVPTKTAKGDMPTIIVEWFDTDKKKSSCTWHFEDELIHISDIVSETTDF